MKAAPVDRRAAVLVGRSLAVGFHPYAAWRAFSRRKRLLIAIGYFAAGFISVLSVLLLSSVAFL
jgi:hypothetical protein